MKLYKLAIVSFLLCVQQDTIGSNYADKSIDEEMYQAIEKSDAKKISDLLNKGANPDSKSIWGATNLGYAILKNKLEIVEILLSNGANPNIKGDSGSSLPLCYAIGNRNLDMVQLLLKYKANVFYKSDHSPSPVQFAQMLLGYPSLSSTRHPIVALLRKHIEKTDCTNTESTEK